MAEQLQTKAEHKQLEDIQQSRAFFRSLSTCCPIGIFSTDTKGCCTYINPRCQSICGFTFEDLGESWVRFVHPDDRSSVFEEWSAHVGECIEFSQEVRLLTPQGTLRWVQVHSSPLWGDQGRLTGYVNTVEEITKRKQIEISDRQQVEEALRESEVLAKAQAEELEAFMKIVPAAVWIVHDPPESHQMTANQAAYELMRATPGSVATATPADGVYPFKFKLQQNGKDVPPEELSLQKAGRTGQVVEEEAELVFDDGIVRHIYGRAVPLRDEAGRVRGVIGAYLDITERKQVEAALASNLMQLEAVLSSMTEGLVISDPQGNILTFNPAALVMHDFQFVEEVRQHVQFFADFFELRELDGQLLSLADWPISRSLAGETFSGRRLRVCRTDTGKTWVAQYGGTPVRNQTGEVILAIVTISDVTSQYEAEEALRASAERLSLALAAAYMGDWIWDAATDIVTFSDRVAEIFSIPPGLHMTWTRMRDLLHEEDRESASLAFELAIIEHGDYDIEYRVVLPDGAHRWIAVKGRAQYDVTGQVLGMLGVVQDVTERKQAEKEREQLLVREQAARAEAETANRIKDEFLAVLSHELRTPLNPILGWAKLLRSYQFDSVKTAQALETIERNAKLQAQLVEDLLDVSRILQGKLSLNVKTVNLATVITAAIETVHLAAIAKSIQIQTVFASGVRTVAGDSNRLQQVVWNLLSNAVKFTPCGGQVEVRLEEVDQLVQMQVIDNGKGIRPDFLPYVFDYFRQADSSITRKFGGLGLGLAIVRQVVELHGGTVYAESLGVGLGATFTVQLPLIEVSKQSHQGDGQTLAVADLSGIKVLVVDDEADLRDLIVFILEQYGAQVSAVASATEALESLTQSLPNILVSDIGMPYVDGYMLIRQVRALAPDRGGQIPAIALTAYAGELNEQQALCVGFQKHLAKPVEPDQLVQAIFSLVNSDQLPTPKQFKIQN